MAHDFAKTRARKAASESRHPEPAQQPTKGMLITGLLTGLVLGFFSFFLVYLTGILPPVNSILADANKPTDAAEQAEAQQRRTEELELAAARLQLEFYKELPNYEVIVDNTAPARPAGSAGNSLSATANAIANIAANTAATTAALTNPSTQATGTDPTFITQDEAVPIPEASQLGAQVEPPLNAQLDNPSPRQGEPSFMIQAGAFQQEAAAVAQSMRLGALGLDARVKKEALLGKTLFLVQAGPYYSRDQLNQAERILRSNSIDSMRIGVSQ